ncbi:MAG: serine/threonine protein kinase [Betaproteobacteria bacterium]|nr:MAG: serine/threonine protein kinase [Betaproteobacteria bacterium]
MMGLPGLKQVAAEPTVLIADPSEETRMLLMQYVAIEWPNARIIEAADSGATIAAQGTQIEECDMVVVGVRQNEEIDASWVESLRTRENKPAVVALVEGDPSSAQALLENGVYCQYRNLMTTDDMRRALRTALRERNGVGDIPDSTVMIDTGIHGSEDSTRPSAPPPKSRVQVRGYRLLKKLGKGGMSEVFLARNMRTRVACALKVLSAEGASNSVLNLFIEECGVISNLDSPYVVKIYEHGVTDDYLFVAMEYLPYGDLRQRIKLGIKPLEALGILLQLARALDTVHRAGLVHGDIKPQNVMFRDEHSLVLVDFGIARVLGTSSALRPGQIIGTPGYISPEHVLDKPLDGRSDLYSTGVLFYELLTGKKPFMSRNVDELLDMHVSAPPPRLSGPLGDYQEIVDRMLAKRPDERFKSAAELIAFLDAEARDTLSSATAI